MARGEWQRVGDRRSIVDELAALQRCEKTRRDDDIETNNETRGKHTSAKRYRETEREYIGTIYGR